LDRRLDGRRTLEEPEGQALSEVVVERGWHTLGCRRSSIPLGESGPPLGRLLATAPNDLVHWHL
jgi:hypothetical protein